MFWTWRVNKELVTISTNNFSLVPLLSVYHIYKFCINCTNAKKMIRKLPTWTFPSKILSPFFNTHKNSFGYIKTTLDISNSKKNLYYSKFTLSVFFITLKKCYIKNLKSVLRYTSFYKQLGSGPSPQSCLYFKDFSGVKVA